MAQKLTGLIAAAGKGARLYPKSGLTPKVLLKIGGESLLEKNIRILADTLGVSEVLILCGHESERIKESIENKNFGCAIKFIQVENPEAGLAAGVLNAEKHISNAFCLVLGDEFYYNSNHAELLSFHETNEGGYSAVCAIKENSDPHQIRKNYSVKIKDGLISTLLEKPEIVENSLLGCGTYLFTPDIFPALASIRPSDRTGRKELADAINLLAQKGGRVLPFFLKGEYVNINTINDYYYASYLSRNINFASQKISLVVPAYNEESSIEYVIRDFKDKVHEIIVVNNGSSDRTAECALRNGAKVFNVSLGGYGESLRFGIENASGDIIILAEADGSFKSRDLAKILEYLKDADMVLGTRTTKQMIEQGANMKPVFRWGNVAVAKLIEILWWSKNEPRLTDVGCTYRGFWKDSYMEIKDRLSGIGPEFSPEMIIEFIRHHMRIIEIPISYHGRLGGESKFSGGSSATIRTGLKMLKLILKKNSVAGTDACHFRHNTPVCINKKKPPFSGRLFLGVTAVSAYFGKRL